MASILTVILIAISVFMVFLIMLQEGKGGGLAALGGTKAAAIEGVTNPIRRATVYLAVLFFAIAIGLGLSNRPPQSQVPFEEEKAEAASMIPTSPTFTPGALAPAVPAANTTPVPVTTPVKVEAQPPVTTPGTLPKIDDKKPDAAKPADPVKAPEPAKTEAPKADATKAPEKK